MKKDNEYDVAEKIGLFGHYERNMIDNTIIWSRGTYNIFGVNPEKFIPDANNYINFVHPYDRAALKTAINTVLEGKENFDIEYRIIRPDGLEKSIRSVGIAIYDSTGKAIKLTGIICDITESKERKRQQKQSKEYYKSLFEDSKSIMLLINPENAHIIDANKTACKFYGYTKKEFTSLKITDINTLPEEEIYEEMEKAKQEKRGHFFFSHKLSNGRVRDVEVHSGPVFVDGKKLLYSIIYDITEKKEAEEKIKQSQRALTSILNSLNAVVYVSDIKTNRVIFINKFGKNIFGDIEGEICWQKLQANQSGPCEFCNNSKLIDEQGNSTGVYVWEFQNTITHKWCMISDLAIQWIDGRLVRIEVATDITRLKQTENEIATLNKYLEEKVKEEVEKQRKQQHLLIQQSKMAAMGEMIGYIAHQWRQPLNSISLIAQDLKDAYEFGELDSNYIFDSTKQITSQIIFLSNTIDDCRDFFKPSKTKISFKINSAIRDVVFLMQGQFRQSNIDTYLTCAYDGIKSKQLTNNAKNICLCEPELVVHGCPNEFKQVILNILINSKDALTSHSKQKLHDKKGIINIELLTSKNMAVVKIMDNGGGIPEDIIDDVFTPYFTTKEDKGTGIGLYMSKTIIEESFGGNIYAENIVNGAMFTIKLNM